MHTKSILFCEISHLPLFIFVFVSFCSYCVLYFLSINQSIGVYRMRWFLAVLGSLFHSSLSYTFSCHSSPRTILPSSLTSSSHLFLGLPLGLVVSKFIHNMFFIQLLIFKILSSVSRISTLKIVTSRVVLCLTLAGSVGHYWTFFM